MNVIHKYWINDYKYLDVILCLKDRLPKEVIHFIAYIYIDLFKSRYLYNIAGALILQSKNKSELWINTKHDLYKILNGINLDAITNTYTTQSIKLASLYINYNIIETLNEIYMIYNRELVLLNIKGFITASIGMNHNMILTTDGVLTTGDNYRGQLGFHQDIKTSFLRRVDINNVIALSCGNDHTFFLSDEGLFFCGYYDEYSNDIFWTPQRIETMKSIQKIMPYYFISNNKIHKINQILRDNVDSKIVIEYDIIDDININPETIIRTVSLREYLLILIRENNANKLYICSRCETLISSHYNLSEKESRSKLFNLPINDVIDISRNLILTTNRLYIFDDYLINNIFVNIIHDGHYVNICDLNDNVDYQGKIYARSFLNKIYDSIMGTSTNFEIF